MKKAKIDEYQLVYHDALSSELPVEDCDIVIGFAEDLTGMTYSSPVPICTFPISLASLERNEANAGHRQRIGLMIVEFLQKVKEKTPVMLPLALFTLDMPFLSQEGIKALAMRARNGAINVVLADGKTLRIGQEPGVSDYFLTWEEVLGIHQIMQMFRSTSISLEQTRVA